MCSHGFLLLKLKSQPTHDDMVRQMKITNWMKTLDAFDTKFRQETLSSIGEGISSRAPMVFSRLTSTRRASLHAGSLGTGEFTTW